MKTSSSLGLAEIVKRLDTIEKQFKRVRGELKQIRRKVDALEVHLEGEVAPYGRKVTPAVEETMIAIKKLAGPGKWVSLRQLSEETKRSLPTEATYVKYLYDNKILQRRSSYSFSRTGRRVRIFVYRPK